MEEKNYLKFLCMIICFPCLVHSSDIIDLGTLSVEGEVREPQIKTYRISKPPEDLFKQISEENFEYIEQVLLEKPSLPLLGEEDE